VFVGGGHIKFKYMNIKDDNVCFYTELNSNALEFNIPENSLESVKVEFEELFDDDTINPVNNSNNTNSLITRESKRFKDYVTRDPKTEKYVMNIRFPTRDSRDIFILACKLFRIVPIISISNIFRQLEEIIRKNM